MTCCLGTGPHPRPAPLIEQPERGRAELRPTIARVARMLDEDEALLEDIASNMDPEDGCLSVMDLDDEVSTTAFTPVGVNFAELP